eukprot:TRINITY_DN13423_c0_g1_i2.p1 TRINITY_DN13423_c0_g1~~TRINITY_DN13423_c0_g1_i2.p1  ORF type:complete len:698 (+),score=159.41 TRINITY_DN13423_c0_g1_i2:79-2172(+)
MDSNNNEQNTTTDEERKPHPLATSNGWVTSKSSRSRINFGTEHNNESNNNGDGKSEYSEGSPVQNTTAISNPPQTRPVSKGWSGAVPRELARASQEISVSPVAHLYASNPTPIPSLPLDQANIETESESSSLSSNQSTSPESGSGTSTPKSSGSGSFVKAGPGGWSIAKGSSRSDSPRMTLLLGKSPLTRIDPQLSSSPDISRRTMTNPSSPSSPLSSPLLSRSSTALGQSNSSEGSDAESPNVRKRSGGDKNPVEVNFDEEEPEPESPDLILQKSDDGEYLVKGGTLEKLVERLAWHKTPDTEFTAAFLLTYRSFTTPTELLNLLIARYNIQAPPTATSEKDLARFDLKKKIIQLRVANVLKMWLDKHFHDFEKDQELLNQVDLFIINQLMVDKEAVAMNLKKLLTNRKVKLELSWSDEAPSTINTRPESLFIDFDPTEVARQLTLIEEKIFKSIELKECLGQAWNKADKDELAPNIVTMIRRFNLVSTWVATEIVKAEILKDRATILTKFIAIAEKCREIGNFNAIMEILAGLQNSAIYRLKKTWEKVNSKQQIQDTYNALMALMSNKGNFKDYRAALHSCHPPCIPYLGVYLTDLTFIEDGMKNTLNGRDDLINFDKRRKVSVVIREIQQYQQTPYHFNVEDTISTYLGNIEGLTEKALYKYSLICEPKGRDAPNGTLKRDLSLGNLPTTLKKD